MGDKKQKRRDSVGAPEAAAFRSTLEAPDIIDLSDDVRSNASAADGERRGLKGSIKKKIGDKTKDQIKAKIFKYLTDPDRQDSFIRLLHTIKNASVVTAVTAVVYAI